jgi:hypothetical protein
VNKPNQEKLLAWWKGLEEGFPWQREDWPFIDAIHRLIERGPEVDGKFVRKWLKKLLAQVERLTHFSSSFTLEDVLTDMLREAGVMVKEGK